MGITPTGLKQVLYWAVYLEDGYFCFQRTGRQEDRAKSELTIKHIAHITLTRLHPNQANKMAEL